MSCTQTPTALSPLTANRPALVATGRVGRGSAVYRRIVAALFLAGFATFSLLYCTQPLLPLFAAHFHATPAASSLALSLTTGCLALAIIVAAMVSESAGRRWLMFISMAGAALLNIAAGLVPAWPLLLLCRALEGCVLGGVPAIAMAYLAEEIDARSLGFAMGLYVGGTAFGGMIGRVGAGLMAAHLSWRAALVGTGLAGLAAAVGFLLLLPPSRFFTPKPGFRPRDHLLAWRMHLTDEGLPLLFSIGFLAMGAFVTVYNYAGFRLMAPPFGLNQTVIGTIFTVYVFGIAASSVAGALVDRLGRAFVLPAGLALALCGTLLTLAQALPVIVIGIVLLTIGFFAAHSAASGWVGQRAKASKGHASSLYLLAYYLGSSVAGTVGGWFWSYAGWTGLAGFAGACLLLALGAGVRLGVIARRAA